MTKADRILINIWRNLFHWDKEDWREIKATYSIRFRFMGRQYRILPGTFLWIFLYLLAGCIGVFGLWAFATCMILLAP